MKRLWFVLMAVLLGAVIVSAMPPHPDLLMKVRAYEVTMPYAMAHRAELLQRGVDAPQLLDLSDKRDATGRLDDTYMNVLVLLATFSDHQYQTEASFFDSLIYGNVLGNMRHFYHELSYGDFHLLTDDYPGETGWTEMPATYAFYVDGQSGFGNYPHNAQGLVEDLVNSVDSYVDFSNYDYDGDNYVDGLMVVHTGPGAELTGSSNDIWSHAWVTRTPQLLDGVYVWGYSMEPEFWRSPGDMTCGVYCHEFGHQLGLPDLYDTDYSSSGIGDFSLMAGGSWNGNLGNRPAHMDAWCKTAVGFATATVLSESATNIEIPACEFSPVIYRVWRDGVGSGNEYFLIENRGPYGYDVGMGGTQGLFIWHVDDNVSTNRHEWYPGHTSSGHYKVALEQSDGRFDLERNTNRGDPGDPFPGYDNNRTFSSTSLPNSMDYTFTPTDVLVNNISDADSVMTFDLSLEVQPFVIVNEPNGGEIWPVALPATIGIQRYETTSPAVVFLSRDGGDTWTELLIMAGAETTWTVMGPTTTQALIKAEIYEEDTLSDVSDATFVIGETVLTILSPNGGETITANEPYRISWDSYGYDGLISLYLNRSYPDGEWEVLYEHIANNGSRQVRMSGPPSDSCRVKIVCDENLAIYDESDGDFQLVQPTITVLVPNGGEEWTEGDTVALQWTSEYLESHVTIKLSRNGESGSWEMVYSMVQNDGEQSWVVTGPHSEFCRLRIASRYDSTVMDISDADFIIHPGASVDCLDGVPLNFGLVSVFPNPFNAACEIRFSVDRPGITSISIFDILGREVERFDNVTNTPGTYHVTWRPKTGSGVYFVRLIQAGQHDLAKLVYLK